MNIRQLNPLHDRRSLESQQRREEEKKTAWRRIAEVEVRLVMIEHKQSM